MPSRRPSKLMLEPDLATKTAMLRPYTGLLNLVGDRGITLTQAGYLPPAMVEAVPKTCSWRTSGSERTIAKFRPTPSWSFENPCSASGLLRKAHNKLTLTKAGLKARANAEALWRSIADGLPLVLTTRGPEVRASHDAGLLLLLGVAAGYPRPERTALVSRMFGHPRLAAESVQLLERPGRPGTPRPDRDRSRARRSTSADGLARPRCRPFAGPGRRSLRARRIAYVTAGGNPKSRSLKTVPASRTNRGRRTDQRTVLNDPVIHALPLATWLADRDLTELSELLYSRRDYLAGDPDHQPARSRRPVGEPLELERRPTVPALACVAGHRGTRDARSIGDDRCPLRFPDHIGQPRAAPCERGRCARSAGRRGGGVVGRRCPLQPGQGLRSLDPRRRWAWDHPATCYWPD